MKALSGKKLHELVRDGSKKLVSVSAAPAGMSSNSRTFLYSLL